MFWLDKHINSFFKLNGVLCIFTIMISIWAALLLGIPHHGSWENFQWRVAFNFIWEPTLIDSALYSLFAVFSFMRKYLVFPCILLYSIGSLNSYMEFLFSIINGEYHRFFGTSDPVIYLPLSFDINSIATALLFFMIFIFSILGTLLWLKKLKRR